MIQSEVVYAGGTISSLMTPDGHREGGHAVDLVEQLNRAIPGALSGIDVTGADFAYLGLSENMDAGYWSGIAQKISQALDRAPRAVIVTHGTDSMEHTARHLENTFADRLNRQGATIILTGANRDIAHPQTDAWANVQFAFSAAQTPLAPGVYIAFHDRLIPAAHAVKEPFDGTEMNYTSRLSPEYQNQQQQQAQREAALIAQLHAALDTKNYHPSHVQEYPVNIIRDNHTQFLTLLKSQPETRAVLLTLYHSGTANTENPDASVALLVEQLRKKGIVSFGATENGEPVDLHAYETSVKLRQAGVVPLYDMPLAVAQEKLRYTAHLKPTDMILKMLENTAGERKMPLQMDDLRALLALYE